MNYYKMAMIASGGLSGGISSSIAGGNFWKGVRQGIITSGLNHLAHSIAFKIDQTKTLEELAKELFGDDYKEKYGVKKLKLGSSISKNGINTNRGTHYYNKGKQMIVCNGEEIGGLTLKNSQTIYISDFVFNYSNQLFEVTLGHELIHSYHFMKGLNNINNSEYAAYQYTIDYYKNVFEQSDKFLKENLINKQKTYKTTKNYDLYKYEKIPRFPIHW